MKMVLSLLSLSLLVLSTTLVSATDLNLSDQGLALQGYDAVSYIDGQPLVGTSTHQVRYQGAVYHFASASNRARFEAEPERFAPAYGGWCAWAMLDGKKVKVNPERFKLINGTNYLFYDGFWGNTLDKWNAKAAEQDEATLIKNADDHWNRLITD